ncbi:MAG: hypothetical protein WAT23_12570, partial [Chromatiaceae bacterium]
RPVANAMRRRDQAFAALFQQAKWEPCKIRLNFQDRCLSRNLSESLLITTFPSRDSAIFCRVEALEPWQFKQHDLFVS